MNNLIIYFCTCGKDKGTKHRLRYSYKEQDWVYIIQESKCTCEHFKNITIEKENNDRN